MTRMRVGYNLVWMGERAGGVGRYAVELLGALAARDDVTVDAFVSRDAPQELLGAPWAEAVRWTTLPVRLAGPPVHLAAQFGAVPALSLGRRLDVLHSPANVGPVRVPGLPCVVTIHDLIAVHMGDAWEAGRAAEGLRRLTLMCARHADRVVTDAESGRDDLVATAGADPARVDVVGAGVRAAPAPPTAEAIAATRARLGLGDGPVVLCVAQKRPYKNQEALVRAIAALRDELAPQLVLPGAATPYEEELRALAAELGVADRVHFPTWVSDEELEALYRLARCFVLPSRMEGFGLPVLEAMARDLPVACSDRWSLPEVAGDAALLFDPDDQDAITRDVRRLLTDDALVARLVAAGRERCETFTWAATAERALASYERARAHRRRGGRAAARG